MEASFGDILSYAKTMITNIEMRFKQQYDQAKTEFEASLNQKSALKHDELESQLNEISEKNECIVQIYH